MGFGHNHFIFKWNEFSWTFGKRLCSGVFSNSTELPLPLFYRVLKNTVACFLRFLGSVLLPKSFLDFLFFSFPFLFIIPTFCNFDSTPHYSVGTLAERSPGRSVLRKCGNYAGLAPSVHLVGSLHAPAIAVSRTTASSQFQLLLSKWNHAPQTGTWTHAARTQTQPKPWLGLEPMHLGLEPGQNPQSSNWDHTPGFRLNEAQVLDVSLQKEFSERQSDG